MAAPRYRLTTGQPGAEVKALSADPERLTDLHRRSRAWWDEKLSERAVARVIARCLEASGKSGAPFAAAEA